MKRSFLLVVAFTAFCVAQSIAQEQQEVKKEVKMEEVNGVKTLTIRTSGNGTESVEVYKGADADKKMAELESEKVSSRQVRKDVQVEEINGKQVVRIKKTVDGPISQDSKETEVNKEQHKVSSEAPKKKEIKRVEIKRN